jgi:diacylglycerol kinase family enzyme
VLGGDGTARTALEVLTPLGIPVVPLPGGTLNRLSRLVYGTASATAILRRVVASGRVRALPGARLGEHRFFVACGFGMAMGMHGVREAVRRGDVVAAIKAFASAARHLFAPSVIIHAGGPTVGWREDTVQMAVVAVGPLAPAFGLPAPMNPAPSLGPGQGGLEVVTARLTGWWQLVGLAPRALMGSWPEAPGITREARDTVEVASIGAAGPVPGLLDGEPIQLDGAAVILFDPACGLVMAD